MTGKTQQNHFKRCLILCGILLVTIPGLCAAGQARATDNGRQAKLSSQLQLVLEDLTDHIVLGSVLMLDAPDMDRVAIAAGYADRERSVPMDTKRGFQIGSQTKMFTAAATLLLVKENRLKLSDRVTGYLDDVPGDRSATIEQLLTHTSGFGDGVISLDVPNPVPTMHIEFEDIQLLSRIEGKQFDAGERFEYNNFGFDILGQIVTKVLGEPFGVFLRRRILVPLNMSDTYIGTTEAWPIDHMARGYVFDERTKSSLEMTGPRDISWASTAGDMISTPNDMMKWVTALASPDNAIGLSLTDFTSGRFKVAETGLFKSYGYGLMHSAGSGVEIWGHGGFIHGYITFSGLHEETGLRFTIMTSLTGDPEDSFDVIIDRLMEVLSLSIHLYSVTGK